MIGDRVRGRAEPLQLRPLVPPALSPLILAHALRDILPVGPLGHHRRQHIQ